MSACIATRKGVWDIQKKFAGRTAFILKDLNEEQVQIMWLCEYGGMNEVPGHVYGVVRMMKKEESFAARAFFRKQLKSVNYLLIRVKPLM